MHVAGAEEACLRRVRVDPTNLYQLLLVTKLPNVGFVSGITSVLGTILIGYHKVCDKKGIVDVGAAEEAAHFEPSSGIWLGNSEEPSPKRLRQKD